MKSAYELAMERFGDDGDEPIKPLSDAQKAELAEIEQRYRAKIAEKEVFLHKQIQEARRSDPASVGAIEKQLVNEKARLDAEMERAKDKVRQREG
jgi:hypothetical protein